jgi:hypothetical protein
MLDCHLSSVLWHLEISSSRRSDQRSVILVHILQLEILLTNLGNEQDSPWAFSG